MGCDRLDLGCDGDAWSLVLHEGCVSAAGCIMNWKCAVKIPNSWAKERFYICIAASFLEAA